MKQIIPPKDGSGWVGFGRENVEVKSLGFVRVGMEFLARAFLNPGISSIFYTSRQSI